MLEAMVGKGGIGLDVAVLYTQKGFVSSDYENVKVKNDYIEIPLNLKFKFGIPVVNPYLAAGPYLDFLVRGDKVKQIGMEVIDEFKSQSFGAGLNFSAGVELLGLLQLGFNYSLGLTDNYKTFTVNDANSYKGKSYTGAITLAVLF